MAELNPITQRAEINRTGLGPASQSADDVSPAVPVAESQIKTSEQIAALKQGVTDSNTRITSTIGVMEDSIKSSNLARDTIQGGIKAATAANQTIQTTKQNAALEAQNATIAAFEAGGGRDMQVNLMTMLGEDINKVNELTAQHADIMDDRTTGIGLIDSAINMFRSQSVAVELRAAKAKRVTTTNQIAAISNGTVQAAQVNDLTQKTLNEGTIKANNELLAATGKIKLAESELAGINANADAMFRLTQLDGLKQSNLLESFKAENTVEQMAVSRERITLQREEMAHQREMFKLNLPKAKADLEAATLRLEQAKKLGPTQQAQAELNLARTTKEHNSTLALEADLVTSVQRGQALAGLPIEDKEAIIWGFKQTGAQGQKYDRLQELGGASDMKLGNTPAEAAANLALVAPSGAVKPNKATKLLQQISGYQKEAYRRSQKAPPKDEATLKADFNTAANNLAASFASNITAGDNSNPYQAPPMDVLLKVSPNFISSPLYKKVLEPMALTEVNPQVIVDASVNGVMSGQITPEEAAAGVSRLFGLAAVYNNTQDGGFARIGLPNQTTFNTKLSRPATFFDKLKIDANAIFNPFEISKQVTAVRDAADGELSENGEAIMREYMNRYNNEVQDVDLMDETQVQQLIIKNLSSSVKADSSAKPQQ